jgi:uncharacterized membrane protein
MEQPVRGSVPATLSYFTLVGWAVAYFLHQREKTTLGACHLRQTMFLYILSLSLFAIETVLEVNPVYGWFLYPLLITVSIALFVLWLVGLVSALQGNVRPIPLIGRAAQEVFAGIEP